MSLTSSATSSLAPGKRFIGHADMRPFPIGSKAFAGALDKFFDVLPAERMRLILPR